MGNISFSDILSRSLRLSSKRREFFIYGFFMAIPPTIASFFFSFWNVRTYEELLQLLLRTPLTTLLVLGLFSLSFLYGKSNLIPQLEGALRQKTPPSFSLKRSLQYWRQGFLVDAVITGFFLLFSFVTLFPSFIAGATLGTVPFLLSFLTELLFIPVLIIGFLVREFTWVYALLSPLRTRAAFEAGGALFTRYRFLTLAFGLLVLIIKALFTFFLILGMLSVVALLQKIVPFSEILFFSLGILLGLTWYHVFRQALWLVFFRSLALPPEEAPRTTLETPFEKEISEIPSA